MTSQKELLFALLILFVSGLAGEIYFYRSVHRPVSNVVLNENRMATTTSLNDSNAELASTAGWKSYINDSFSFQYPSDYTATSSQILGEGKVIDTYVVPDINAVDQGDGPCGHISSSIYHFEANVLNSEPIGFESNPDSSTTSEYNPEETYSVSGLHEVIGTQVGGKILFNIRTCQGIANEDDPAKTALSAEAFNGNEGVMLYFNLPFNQDGSIKVKNIDAVAQELLYGTYSGPEQSSINEVKDILSTFRFINLSTISTTTVLTQ